MLSNRRGFLNTLLALPWVGGVLAKLMPAAHAALPGRRDVYKELGIRPFINAAGTYTALTGSLMPREVVEAMSAAAGQFVHLSELQAAVGKKIAALVGAEAALVSAGAASALSLGTSACVTGKDLDKVRRLPDTTGMKNEVIIQKGHRFPYEHAVRNVGVRLVEVETRADLERAVNERTALLLFVNSRTPEGQIKADEFAQLGRKLGVPTMNDAAADVPPATNLSRFLKLGFDLVIFSGGKGLRGPQSAGLLLGRRDLIEAAALNNNPHGDALCRTNKVGKEELVGMWAALDYYLKQDHDALWREWDRRVQGIAELVGKVKGVRTERFVPEIANHVPHLRIAWTGGTLPTPADVVKLLRSGDPSIEIRSSTNDAIEVSVWMLESGEDQVIGKRLVEILQKS